MKNKMILIVLPVLLLICVLIWMKPLKEFFVKESVLDKSYAKKLKKWEKNVILKKDFSSTIPVLVLRVLK